MPQMRLLPISFLFLYMLYDVPLNASGSTKCTSIIFLSATGMGKKRQRNGMLRQEHRGEVIISP
jgi:hypothetical protein